MCAQSAECDVPVPGIPVPGICSLFLMVSEPVSEKFGTEKSLRIGIEKNLVPKKVSESVSKKFGTEKVSESVSEKFGTGKKSQNRHWKNLVPELIFVAKI